MHEAQFVGQATVLIKSVKIPSISAFKKNLFPSNFKPRINSKSVSKTLSNKKIMTVMKSA